MLKRVFAALFAMALEVDWPPPSMQVARALVTVGTLLRIVYACAPAEITPVTYAARLAAETATSWPASLNCAITHGREASSFPPVALLTIAGGASASLVGGLSVDAFATTTLGRDHGQEVGAQVGVKAAF